MIIGFSGEMGVGKSTAIEILKAMAPSTAPVFNVKFAQPLYDIQEYAYDRVSSVYERPESFVKDRKLLQWIGTEWGRDSISPTVWVDLWKAEVKWIKDSWSGATITCDDVRFDNEAEAIKAIGGTVVKIISSNTKERIDIGAGIVHHKSETGISHKFIDAWIDNNGTLAELETKMYNLISFIKDRGTENGF